MFLYLFDWDGLRPQPNRIFNDTFRLKKSEQSFNVAWPESGTWPQKKPSRLPHCMEPKNWSKPIVKLYQSKKNLVKQCFINRRWYTCTPTYWGWHFGVPAFNQIKSNLFLLALHNLLFYYNFLSEKIYPSSLIFITKIFIRKTGTCNFTCNLANPENIDVYNFIACLKYKNHKEIV